MIVIMKNHSLNTSADKPLGWRKFFWSEISLFVISAIVYIAGYELTGTILCLLVVLMMLVFDVICALPYKGPISKFERIKHSFQSMPFGYRFVHDFIGLAVFGYLIGFDNWWFWMFFVFFVIAEIRYYKLHKQ